MYGRKEECIFLVRKLAVLLEQDAQELQPFLKGEIYDAYKELVYSEKSLAEEMEKAILRHY